METNGSNGSGDRKLLAWMFGAALLAACSLQMFLSWDGRQARDLTLEQAIEASREGVYAPTARGRLYTITKLAIEELRRASESGDERSQNMLALIEKLLR